MSYKKPPERTPEEWKAFNYWYGHPVEAIKDWFGATPDDWQGDLLNGLFAGELDRAAIKSAHGPGKTAVMAWAGLIFLNCKEGARVPITAPTLSQLSDVLFPEFAKWLYRAPEKIQNEWAISATHIKHKAKEHEWFAVGRTSNKPANLQGFHKENVLILIDEASAVPKNVFEVIEGALSEAGDQGRVAKLLMGGNPNFNDGELYDAFGKNAELYHRVTVTGDKSLLEELGVEQGGAHPRNGNVYYSPRVKPKYANVIAHKYGKDSAVYDVRVRGMFPRVQEDVVIPLDWVQKASLLPIPEFDLIKHRVTLVLDVARAGLNESVLGYFRGGVMYKMKGLRSKTTSAVVDLVHDAVLEIIKAGLMLENIIVDEPGVGGGVIDAIRRNHGYPVTPYHGGLGLEAGVDPEDEIRMFANRRSRDWWALRRKIESGLYPVLPDEELIAQLSILKYKYNTKDKIQVESKEDLKDRAGKDASPDRADVLVMGTAPWYNPARVHGALVMDDVFFGEDRQILGE